jgi:hypothetical protein
MNSFIVQWTHALVPLLLVPVVIGLFVCVALACVDIGVLIGERGSLRRHERPGNVSDIERRAHRRIERADILTRTAPMLGLMATLISLGPGLMALSNGNLNLLVRRRWYDEALLRWEQQA